STRDWSSDVCSSDLVLVLGCELRPELDVRRRSASLLPHLDLPGLVAHHCGEHLLGELLALRRYALRDRPPPDFVPRRRPLRARADRKSTRLNSSHEW